MTNDPSWAMAVPVDWRNGSASVATPWSKAHVSTTPLAKRTFHLPAGPAGPAGAGGSAGANSGSNRRAARTASARDMSGPLRATGAGPVIVLAGTRQRNVSVAAL